MTLFALSKAGYGSLIELEQLGTDDFLDLVEFENISSDIQNHLLNKRG